MSTTFRHFFPLALLRLLLAFSGGLSAASVLAEVNVPPPETANPTARPGGGNLPVALAQESRSTAQVRIGPDASGHFMGLGSVNSKDVKFLVDTGASMVVVPEALATRIGLKKGQPLPFKTGGGVIIHFATTLDKLRIGEIELNQVSAAINPAMRDDFILLGMSALQALELTQQDGSMLLTQNQINRPLPQEKPPEEAPVRFKKSVRECMGSNKAVDSKTLACLKGLDNQ